MLLSPTLTTEQTAKAATFVNPVITDTVGRDHGDPFVLRYLDEYFLYHTTDDGDRGVSVHRSHDLVHWEFAGYALEAGGPDSWAQTDLWAPEVMYWHGTFYMYVSGTVFAPNGHGNDTRRRQGVARAQNPLGPFVLDPEPLVRDHYSIDGHPFQDEDGSLWLFYNIRGDEVTFNGKPGSGNVVDRLLDPGTLEGNPAKVTFPSQEWEASVRLGQYWNEGSWVLKRRGRYFQLYSGSYYRESTYGIGLSAADSPRGPWVKHEQNPIFAMGERITGPGHHSVILAPDGVSYYAVYHGYDGPTEGRKVHLDRLRWCGDRPVIGTGRRLGRPTEDAQPVPWQPAYDPAVPYWHADLWVDGCLLHVDDERVEWIPQAHPVRVRVNQSKDGLRAWVDGRLAVQVEGYHAPKLSSDGNILSSSLTSHLEDEAVRWLAPGQKRSWAWGGAGPLEVTVAVRGSAEIIAGNSREEVVSPASEYGLGQLFAADGADKITIVAGSSGAHVTDLFVAARPAT